MLRRSGDHLPGIHLFVSVVLVFTGVLPAYVGAATFTVTNIADSGPGSLRQAILDANRFPDEDRIEFDIPGAFLHSICPASALPAVVYPVTIDGYTQPGASPNTLEMGNNAVLLIEVNGSCIRELASGIVITGFNVVVRGLVINRFTYWGVALYDLSSVGNTVEGCFIGTNASGTAAAANLDGVFFAGAHASLLGGTTPQARNLVSGNTLGGVGIAGGSADNNVVQGNYIGTNAAGTAPIPNGRDAVIIFEGARNNLIGGSVPGAGNVLSGNNRWGIGIGTTGNVVQGNRIGTDAGGSAPLPNTSHGVAMAGAGIQDNVIGGTEPGEGNIIAFNREDGVLIDSGVRNAIRGNSIFSHATGLGIRLLNGGNNNQAAPLLSSATSDGTTTTVEGSLTSMPDTVFSVDFFVNDVCHPSGSGEGESFLGLGQVATDKTGMGTFTVTFEVGLDPGRLITATATDPSNNTSQFSACLEVLN